MRIVDNTRKILSKGGFPRATRHAILKIEQIINQFQARAQQTKEKIASRVICRLVENGPNKALGLDKISVLSSILKSVAGIVSELKIFNKSISSGIFPESVAYL